MTKTKHKIFLLAFFFFSASWVYLMISEDTRTYGNIYFGALQVIAGLTVLYHRVSFDISPKDKVTGELILLERVENSEGHSFRFHYQYVYNGEIKDYKSDSVFINKKSKVIGEKVELLINARKPKQVRLNSKRHTFLEYFSIFIVIALGLSLILFADAISIYITKNY